MAVPIRILARSLPVLSSGHLSTFVLLRNTQQCFCPPISCIQHRQRSRKAWSKFPMEDGVTRIEEMGHKLNPPPARKQNEELPSDQGFKIDSTGQIFSSYVPVEKKEFVLSGKGLGQRWEAIKASVMSTYAIAMIKRKAKPFKVVEFAKIAQRKFIDVNNALQQENNKNAELKMKDDATLLVIKGLTRQFLDPSRKVYWRFIKEIDRPRVVHARITAVYEKENIYAQVTVRMHSEQILAIRDRHNRIIKGDIKTSKNVLDYVVFEKHLADKYGKWRICGKLAPSN